MVVPQRGLELASDPNSLSELAFRTLSAAICDGTLEAGETLRVEDLQSWLGVSRTPIREALNRLSALGLVSTQPGRFTRVGRTDSHLHAETIELLGYHGAFFIRVAAARFTDSQVTTALSLVDGIASAAESNDSRAWRRAIRAFLDHVWSVAAGPVARQIMGDLALVVDANLRNAEIVPRDKRLRQDGHQRLKDALAQRDPDYADYAFRVLYPPVPSNDALAATQPITLPPTHLSPHVESTTIK